MGEVTDRVEAALLTMVTGRRIGDQLPSERDLISQLNAGRTTVRTVLQKLTQQGLIEPQHGRGYFIRRHPDR